MSRRSAGTLILLAALPAALGGCAPRSIEDGLFPLEYHDPRRPAIAVQYPPGAARIISEYGSHTNATGQARTYTHNGLDLGRFGDEVLAMADGIVTRARGQRMGQHDHAVSWPR